MAATVQVVDDESMIRELYVTWLDGDYDVREAADGEAALEDIDDDVAVVLLDRRMPGLRGDEVVRRIRDREFDCRVVIVSAVDPEVAVLELPFDDYLVKPAEVDDLRSAVEMAMERNELDPTEREYATVLAKLGLLEHHHTATAEDVIAKLRDHRESLQAELGDRAAELDERAAEGSLVLQPPTVVTGDE